MAFVDSKESRFLIDDASGVQRDLSPYVIEVSGLPGERGLNEVTALSETGARFVPGLEAVTFTLRGLFDGTAGTGPDAVLGPLRSHSAPVAFAYGPEGSDPGKVKYWGKCWVASYQVRSRAGGPVEWTAVLRVDGVVSRGTF